MPRLSTHALVWGCCWVLAAPAWAQVPRLSDSPDTAITGLRSADASSRRAAVLSLAKFKNQEQVRNALAATLQQDADATVRRDAAAALTRMGPKAKKALAEAAICDPEPTIRTALASAARGAKVVCHLTPPAEAVSTALPSSESELLASLSHPWPGIRLAVVRALAAQKSSRGYQVIWTMASKDPVWSIRISSIRVLTRAFGARFSPVLQYALSQDPDARVRAVALEALGFTKDPKAVSLISASAKVEEESSVQRAAVTALSQIADGNALAALVEISETHKSDDTRAAAVEAMAGLRAHRASVQPLLARLLAQSKSGKVRAAALKGLSASFTNEACTARAERMKDPDANVRRAVVEQLARCAARIAKPPLVEAVRSDGDAGVRRAALELLLNARAPESQELAVSALQGDREAAIRKLALESLLKSSPKGRVLPLEAVAKADPDPALRALAAQGLSKFPTPTAATTLAAVVTKDSSVPVRLQAVKVLAQLDDAAAFSVLQRVATKDSSAEVRKAAATGAAQSPAQRAWVEGLLTQTLDQEPEVRIKALSQLCTLMLPRAHRALLVALWSDADARVRTTAAKCFGDFDHPVVDIALSVAHSTDTDPEVIRTIEDSQRQRVDRMTRLLGQFSQADPAKRIEATQTLARSPNPKVREAIERLLTKDDSPAVRKEAARAVALYRDNRALQKLMQASQTDAEGAIRQQSTSLYNRLREAWAAARNDHNINSLLLQLTSNDPEARLRAAGVLGSLRDKRAYNYLRSAAAATDARLRFAATIALAVGDSRWIAQAARLEKDPPTRERFIQVKFLLGTTPDKVIAALSSKTTDEVMRGIEAAAIKPNPNLVPWLIQAALLNLDAGVREAAVRALVLYNQPLAQWAIRIAAEQDSSKINRKLMWQWAVHVDAKAGSSS